MHVSCGTIDGKIALCGSVVHHLQDVVIRWPTSCFHLGPLYVYKNYYQWVLVWLCIWTLTTHAWCSNTFSLLFQLVWCGLQCGLPSEVWTMSRMWFCWKELFFLRVIIYNDISDLWSFSNNDQSEWCMLMCAGVFTLTLLLSLRHLHCILV